MPCSIRFQENEIVLIDGEAYRFARKVGSEHLFQKRSNGQRLTLSCAQIRVRLVANTMEIIGFPPKGKSDEDLAPRDEIMLSQHERRVRFLRSQFVTLAQSSYPHGLRLREAAYIIANYKNAKYKLKDENGQDQPVPSPASLVKWVKRAMATRNDPRQLAPETSKRGNRTRRMPQELIDLIDRAIREVFLSVTRPNLGAVCRQLEADVIEHNAKPGIEKLKVPSRTTVSKALNRYSPELLTALRLGKVEHRARHVEVGTAETTMAINERWMIDSHKIDLEVLGDGSEKPYRPWLVAVMDCHSRAIVGYSFCRQPNTNAVRMALRNAFLPKEAMENRFPGIAAKWPMHGMPLTLVCDNGSEFKNKAVETLMNKMLITTDFNAPFAPWLKGMIERLFLTIEENAFKDLPGARAPFVKLTDDNSVRTVPVLKLADVEERFVRWIVDVYHRELHGSLETSPLEAWKKSAQKFPPKLVSSRLADDVLKLAVAREVTPKGIKFETLYYRCPEIDSVIGNGETVSIRIDQGDLANIEVLHPFERKYLQAPIRPEYRKFADGVSLADYMWAKAERRSSRRAYRQGVEDGIASANKDSSNFRTEAFNESTRVREELKKDRKLSDVLKDTEDNGAVDPFADASEMPPQGPGPDQATSSKGASDDAKSAEPAPSAQATEEPQKARRPLKTTILPKENQ